MLMKSYRLTSNLMTQLGTRNFRTAVLLAGCGTRDGTDITEAVSVMISL